MFTQDDIIKAIQVGLESNLLSNGLFDLQNRYRIQCLVIQDSLAMQQICLLSWEVVAVWSWYSITKFGEEWKNVKKYYKHNKIVTVFKEFVRIFNNPDYNYESKFICPSCGRPFLKKVYPFKMQDSNYIHVCDRCISNT